MALINAKVAGQGNQIDIGGALPAILSALAAAAAPIEVDDITALTGDQLDALENTNLERQRKVSNHS